MVSVVFEYDGFQMGRAGMDLNATFHLLREVSLKIQKF